MRNLSRTKYVLLLAASLVVFVSLLWPLKLDTQGSQLLALGYYGSDIGPALQLGLAAHGYAEEPNGRFVKTYAGLVVKYERVVTLEGLAADRSSGVGGPAEYFVVTHQTAATVRAFWVLFYADNAPGLISHIAETHFLESDDGRVLKVE